MSIVQCQSIFHRLQTIEQFCVQVFCKIGNKATTEGGADEEELDLEPSREETT